MTKPLPRDVPRIFQIFRNFLLGRKHKSALRFAEDISKRSQPFPNIPLGPANRIYGNYYVGRDPRGEVKHPTELYGEAVKKQKLLKAKSDKWERCEVRKIRDVVTTVPGKVHNWDKIVD